MIHRIWHGWTLPEDADTYQRLVDQEVVPSILARTIPGLHRVDILRRRKEDDGEEVEFVTIMEFDDWEAVEAFAGPGGTAAYVPTEARKVLRRFDVHSRHYEVVASHRAEQA